MQSKQTKNQIARINRQLRRKGEAVRAAREGTSLWVDVGPFWTVDIDRNFLITPHVSLDTLEQEFKLKQDEHRRAKQALDEAKQTLRDLKAVIKGTKMTMAQRKKYGLPPCD